MRRLLLRHRLLVAAALAALASLAAPARAAGSKEPFGTLGVDEVYGLVRAGSASIFDANSAETYAAGHVPGAILVPDGNVDPKVLPADHARHLVFYCMNPH
jgi:hypothetical protein